MLTYNSSIWTVVFFVYLYKNKILFMEVKIVNKSNHRTPEYESAGAAGFDLKANINEPMVIEPLERVLVPTGIFMELPHGYECQIRPRSGMAYKYGMCVANAPGTVN